MARWRQVLMLAALVVVGVAALQVSAARADRRDFTLVNGGSAAIVELYVSASSDADWGPDILGAGVVEPGSAVDVTFTDSDAVTCVYDIRVVWRGGESSVRYGVDLCNTTTISFP